MASALGVSSFRASTFCVVPRVDPKGEAYRTSGKFYQGFVIAFTLFMCASQEVAGRAYGLGRVPRLVRLNVLIPGAVGLLFIGVGDDLPRVKQQERLGIKTPWALADPENWRRTSALAVPASWRWVLA